MKLKRIILSLMCAGALTASAVPAKHGASYQYTQADGTTITLRLVGDEHNHYYLTTDDKVVMAYADRFCYADIDADGELVITNVLAHNPEIRTAEESRIADNIDRQLVKSKIMSPKPAAPLSRANSQDGKGKMMSNFPTKGEVRSLVFLVSYSDVDFVTEDVRSYFDRLLNEEGFSENGARGSARDFYMEASMGQFKPHFDVFGPVKLPQPQSFYGADYGPIYDRNAAQMMLHAAQAIDSEINFKDYDLDGDGFVDNVYIFYAGLGQNFGGAPETVWPHQGSVGYNLTYRFDGVMLSRYACSAEIIRDHPDGIGTFCHEFGHVLGLPDLYNTDDSTLPYTPYQYALMDQGSYNDDGRCPPTLSAFERNALGWMGDNLVEITGPASCTLDHVMTSNMAYLINTNRPDEYFIFENRQKNGWDSFIPNHGMLIWHIDYDSRAFNNGLTNNTESHQRVDIVEAGGVIGTSGMTLRRYPFPGLSKVTSFVYGGKPSFETWDGTDLGLPITNIKETGGVITFDVVGGGADPAGVEDVTIDNEISYQINGRHISVSVNGPITVADITGRLIATATDSLSADIATPGIYIIATANGSVKVTIR